MDARTIVLEKNNRFRETVRVEGRIPFPRMKEIACSIYELHDMEWSRKQWIGFFTSHHVSQYLVEDRLSRRWLNHGVQVLVVIVATLLTGLVVVPLILVTYKLFPGLGDGAFPLFLLFGMAIWLPIGAGVEIATEKLGWLKSRDTFYKPKWVAPKSEPKPATVRPIKPPRIQTSSRTIGLNVPTFSDAPFWQQLLRGTWIFLVFLGTGLVALAEVLGHIGEAIEEHFGESIAFAIHKLTGFTTVVFAGLGLIWFTLDLITGPDPTARNGMFTCLVIWFLSIVVWHSTSPEKIKADRAKQLIKSGLKQRVTDEALRKRVMELMDDDS